MAWVQAYVTVVIHLFMFKKNSVFLINTGTNLCRREQASKTLDYLAQELMQYENVDA